MTVKHRLFFKTLCVKKGDVVCVAGSGGKTGLIMHLASELKQQGFTVLVSTTTRFASSEVTDEFDFMIRLEEEKAYAPKISDLEQAVKNYDVVLIEADGSADKPLKGWRSDEPVIPHFATLTIGVIDISTIGTSPLIHRPELFEKITGTTKNITPDALAKVIDSDIGIFRNSAKTRNIVYLSKAESESDFCNSLAVAHLTEKEVFCGSIMKKQIKKIPVLTAVIMAAGNSRRMGENKLLLPLNDSSILEHLLKNIPDRIFRKIVLVCSDKTVADKAKQYPVSIIKTEKGHEKNVTIKLGTQTCAQSDGIMFFVADQPFLKSATICRLASVFMEDTSKIVIPICKGKNRNPVIFPQMVYSELMKLEGDHGGRDVINQHPELCRYVSFEDEIQFADIDTRQDYEKYL